MLIDKLIMGNLQPINNVIQLRFFTKYLLLWLLQPIYELKNLKDSSDLIIEGL